MERVKKEGELQAFRVKMMRLREKCMSVCVCFILHFRGQSQTVYIIRSVLSLLAGLCSGPVFSVLCF